MKNLKFRLITEQGIFHAPSESFSVSFHDTGTMMSLWASDGMVDEVPVSSVDLFTGLHDKNGKEIYEGDVVNYYRAIDGLLISRGKIMHSLDHSKALDINQDRNLSCDGDGEGFLSTYGLVCSRNYFMALCHYCRPYEYMEIIGNIHQNPELLERTE